MYGLWKNLRPQSVVAHLVRERDEIDSYRLCKSIYVHSIKGSLIPLSVSTAIT